MQGKLSRRKIAVYVADSLTAGAVPAHTLQEIAAYLLDTGRVRERQLVVRAIEDELEQRGIVVATVTSARPLDEQLKTELSRHITGNEVHLREVIDPSVIGGVRIQTPSQQMDATIARKLTALRGAKL